jgi:hypothetical protein
MAELKSSDEELQRAERKRDEVLEELIEENAPHDSEADKIRCIKKAILHIENNQLAEFLGLSQNYVTKFRVTLRGDVIRSDIPSPYARRSANGMTMLASVAARPPS